ncbi:MAG: NAD(P)/FAD-dependent oxidoreductase [Alphaproteobacteria bacterium]|jgi:gamma-glutamylputrescine oxidase
MSSGYLDIHYARTRTPGAQRSALDGHIKTQVCVIGGGLAGLNTALGLAERGVTDVVLLEGQRVGWGASGRNGGFVGASYAADTDYLIRKVGLGHTKRLIGLGQQAVTLIQDRMKRYDIACGPNPHGHVAASWYDNPDAVKEWIDFERENFGETIDFIPREELRESYAASDMYFDGAVDHSSFWFHPLNYCLGVARAAESLGVTIHEHSPARTVLTEGKACMVTTDQGIVEADKIVVATGGYDRSLVAELGAAFQQVATYVIVTEPVEEELISSAIKTHCAIHDDRFSLDYYRRLEDNRVLWGGRGTTRVTEPHNLRHLMQGDMIRVYPQLADVKVETAWSGIMSYPIHRMIQMGELKPGLWYGQGFGGQGMAQTTVAGEALAAAIAEGDDTIDLFAPFGLNWAGGPVGKMYGEAYRLYVRAYDQITTARDRRRAGRRL